MLILSKNDIQNLISMKEAIAISKEALSLYSQGNAIVPLRMHLNISAQNGQSVIMPAYVNDINALGVKLVSIFPNNVKLNKAAVVAQVLLLDNKTGEVCALLDGTYLTQFRTGAVQGAATDLLSIPHAKIGFLFGAGGQAFHQLEAMLTARDLDKMYVYSRSFEKTRAFVDAIKNDFAHFSTEIIAVDNITKALPEADIITTVTTSTTPVFDGTLIKTGAHINGMGSYTPEMQELPASILQRASKIFFDTKEGVLSEAGDILIPLQNGEISENYFSGELGELALEKATGRESAQDITLFKSVGSAVLDVVMAQKIYHKALKRGMGTTVAL